VCDGKLLALKVELPKLQSCAAVKGGKVGFLGKYIAWGQEICKINKKFIVIFRLTDYYDVFSSKD
jgi:hypothetical protein